MFFCHSSLMTSDGDPTTLPISPSGSSSEYSYPISSLVHSFHSFHSFSRGSSRLFAPPIEHPSLAQLLEALLQEIDAVERQRHIHRQRELLSDAPGRAGRRSARIGGVGFEDHDLGDPPWIAGLWTNHDKSYRWFTILWLTVCHGKIPFLRTVNHLFL